jgi:hypothetical protein
MLIDEIVYITKGSLKTHINGIVDALVLKSIFNVKLSIIWTHKSIKYDDIYDDHPDFEWKELSQLEGTNYIYNTDYQIEYLKNLQKLMKSDKVCNKHQSLVLECGEPLGYRLFHNISDYFIIRSQKYSDLVDNYISIGFMGSLNLVDRPNKPFVFGDDLSGYNTLSIDLSEFGKIDDEMDEYIRIIIASRSSAFVCTDVKQLVMTIESASIQLVPVRFAFNPRELIPAYVKPLVATDFMNTPYVLFPDMKKMSKPLL